MNSCICEVVAEAQGGNQEHPQMQYPSAVTLSGHPTGRGRVDPTGAVTPPHCAQAGPSTRVFYAKGNTNLHHSK